MSAPSSATSSPQVGPTPANPLPQLKPLDQKVQNTASATFSYYEQRLAYGSGRFGPQANIRF